MGWLFVPVFMYKFSMLKLAVGGIEGFTERSDLTSSVSKAGPLQSHHLTDSRHGRAVRVLLGHSTKTTPLPAKHSTKEPCCSS